MDTMTQLDQLDDFYVTSDLWLGRSQILEIGKRTRWGSVDKMDQALIRSWNKVVGPEDHIVCLGNFAWDPMTARNALDRLNGHIYFLKGSADDALLEVHLEFEQVSILEGDIITVPQHDLVLSHYPLRMWAGQDSGTLHLHGHAIYSHETNLALERRFNMCTDNWGFSPIKLSTLKDLLNEFKK
jgi:calcineurin-like phosphoesterase family protein